MNLDGKRIILTGAASGIGAALLARLVAANARIIAADLRADQISVGTNVIPFAGDLSLPETVDALFDFARESLGGVDIFIANAGFAYYERLGKPDWAHIERIYGLNVISPLYGLQKMAALHADGGAYTVAITASAMAHLAIPGYALYAGTKAALHRFAEAYRYELPAHGHLMMIYPIATRTRFFNAAGDGTPRSVPSQTADYVAARIMAGLKRDSRAVYPSLTFVIYNWLCGVFPPLRRVQLSISAGQFRRWSRRHRPDAGRLH